MEELTTAEILPIGIQDDADSIPFQDNFEALKNKINEVIQEFTDLSSSTSTSEIISSRDEFQTLDDRLHKTQTLLGNGVIMFNRTINSCDSIVGWTAGTGATAVAINTTTYVEGTGSVEMGKSTVVATDIEYDLDISSGDYEGRYIKFDLYIVNAVALAKIDNIYFDITLDANFTTNYKRFTLSDLAVGWNEITLDVDNPTSTTGTVDDDDLIINGRVYIVTNNNADTLTAGDLIIDNVRFTGTEFKIKAQSTPDMTVQALSGHAVINGYAIEKTSAQNSGTITAPTANPRKDLVTLNFNGILTIFTGSENASPIRPNTPYNHIALAEIYNRVGETSIENADDSSNGYITDLRKIQSNHPIFLSGSGVPIGTIIAIHPNVLSAYQPDNIGDNYEPCDGVATLPTAYFDPSDDANVPDLTDDRFLMGDTVYGVGGNTSNEIDFGHNHNWMFQGFSLSDRTYNSDGDEIAMANNTESNANYGLSVVAKTSPTIDLVGDEGWTSEGLYTAIDIKPQYFSVLYYIRIK